MQNLTSMPSHKEGPMPSESGSSLPGGIIGLLSYSCALVIPFLLYGSNTLFFFLYTWPFFLALMPVSLLIGVLLSLAWRGNLLFTLLSTILTVICLFWLLFSFLSGW